MNMQSAANTAFDDSRDFNGEGVTRALPKESILEAIGNTPVVRLRKIFSEWSIEVYGKLEALNPGGSMKDRPAYNMITKGMEAGLITKDTTVVESSSGNFAIGLAQVCGYLGLRLICVVDIKTTQQNIKILEAYGARVDLITEPDPATGEYLQARLNRIRHVLESVPNSFWPNQYANLNNAGAHYDTTMPEIVNVLGHDIDYLFLATSTCGTLRGCADYIHDHGMPTKIVAVDAIGSIIFGHPPGKRLLPGHGAGVVPKLFSSDLADQVVMVSDLDCVIGCRRLVQREAILAGASSGGVISAIERLAAEGQIPRDARCAAVLADRGERYLDTVYSDTWVQSHLGVEGLA
jgi:N-(2-amino-2-carboxyethyl)-L-glutamate synthase